MVTDRISSGRRIIGGGGVWGVPCEILKFQVYSGKFVKITITVEADYRCMKMLQLTVIAASNAARRIKETQLLTPILCSDPPDVLFAESAIVHSACILYLHAYCTCMHTVPYTRCHALHCVKQHDRMI